MFETLTNRLTDAFAQLTRKGVLRDEDVGEALREVRVALLEADVALPVVKDLVAEIQKEAVGAAVVRSITPGQMVVKIVHDHLTKVLGGTSSSLTLSNSPPTIFLMVGLQGSGKTTTAGKIALRLSQGRKKVLLASLDTRRPAAQEQLEILARQIGVASLPIVPGQSPEDIAKRALAGARLEGYDVLILDSAGRLAIDDEMMDEAKRIKDLSKPIETLLVADAMTGQDAVTVGRAFNDRVGVTGIVLTRMDGDARGGAALSMRQITGAPIKLIGVGEKLDALEDFHPDRIASRILGQGDVIALVEKAAQVVEEEEARKLAAKVQAGTFDLDDMRNQLKQLRKMGGLSGVMNFLPGVAKVKQQLANAKVDDKMISRQEAIIGSMTLKERKNPDLLNASRRRRIAAGSGTKVEEVNRLIKQYRDMATMMKKMRKLGSAGLARTGLAGLMPRQH
ncbi:MAG: signal recognition particle protein [Gemmatimonas sp.]